MNDPVKAFSSDAEKEALILLEKRSQTILKDKRRFGG